MPTPVSAPPRPALALPPRPARRRGLWLLPLGLSLLLVAGVLLWLRQTEQNDLEVQRQEMISDALSLEGRFEAGLEAELDRLKELAIRIDTGVARTAGFGTLPEVVQGLQHLWLSVTWLDAANRIVAHLPEQEPRPDAALHPNAPATGLSAHLSVPLHADGKLIARLSPTNMLRQNVPWWLTRKYDVRLVDSFGDVIASTTEGLDLGDHQSYRISMSPMLADSYLELTARDRIASWYRTLPVALVSVFLALIVVSTAMLRRQMREVSHAEEAWRTEAAWRSAMEDSLTVGLRARDLEGRVVYVNRTLCAMLGYPPEELVGLMPPMPYWPPDSLEAAMQRHLRNMAGNAPREGYESVWCHRDGHRIDVMIYEARLVDAHGRHIGWMGSIIDITERKRLEERDRRQTESMAHHARLTMLGEVASTLAHELNQPLTAIASYNAGIVNSLQRQPAPDPVVMRALQRMGEQAAHAGAIVQRIREFLTRRAPRLEPCDINSVVRGAVALLTRELDRHQVHVGLRLDSQLGGVVADHVLIEQVVINLVRNASDALAGREGERRVDVVTSRSADDRFVRIDVRDNGPGLAGQRIETLCAPFYSTKTEGMGMGLAICRSIIEAHHGVFDASEVRGGGACFSLTLPVDLQALPLAEEEDMA